MVASLASVPDPPPAAARLRRCATAGRVRNAPPSSHLQVRCVPADVAGCHSTWPHRSSHTSPSLGLPGGSIMPSVRIDIGIAPPGRAALIPTTSGRQGRDITPPALSMYSLRTVSPPQCELGDHVPADEHSQLMASWMCCSATHCSPNRGVYATTTGWKKARKGGGQCLVGERVRGRSMGSAAGSCAAFVFILVGGLGMQRSHVCNWWGSALVRLSTLPLPLTAASPTARRTEQN